MSLLALNRRLIPLEKPREEDGNRLSELGGVDIKFSASRDALGNRELFGENRYASSQGLPKHSLAGADSFMAHAKMLVQEAGSFQIDRECTQHAQPYQAEVSFRGTTEGISAHFRTFYANQAVHTLDDYVEVLLPFTSNNTGVYQASIRGRYHFIESEQSAKQLWEKALRIWEMAQGK